MSGRKSYRPKRFLSTHATPHPNTKNLDRLSRERATPAAEVWAFDPNRKTFVYWMTTKMHKAVEMVAENNHGLTSGRSLFNWTWFYLY